MLNGFCIYGTCTFKGKKVANLQERHIVQLQLAYLDLCMIEILYDPSQPADLLPILQTL